MAKQTNGDVTITNNNGETEKANGQNRKRAREVFDGYPEINEIYFTDDDTAFLTENDAKNHAKTLEKKRNINKKTIICCQG